MYKQNNEVEGELFIQDTNGEKQRIIRMQPHESEEGLGIHIPSDGSQKNQLNNILKKTDKWITITKRNLHRTKDGCVKNNNILLHCNEPRQKRPAQNINPSLQNCLATDGNSANATVTLPLRQLTLPRN